MQLLFLVHSILFSFLFNNSSNEDSTSKVLSKYNNIAISYNSYASYESALKDEGNINWDEELEKANAVTSAFAAVELQKHFQLIGKEIRITNYASNSVANTIVLILKEDFKTNHPAAASKIDLSALGNQGFSITPYKNSLFITANTRVGLLYGSYELLKKMGFAWYNPNEISIPKRVNKKIKSFEINKAPYIDLRGFWTFSEDELTDKRALWLARNKFNIAGKMNSQLAKKLGIKIWGGEHNLIQEEFSKEGLFESHPDWYTQYNDKRIPVKATGNYVNPSFANIEAAAYFSKRLLERLTVGDLTHIDILNIWPADRRRGRLDQSILAKNTGNFTDTILFFYSIIAENLQTAYEKGILNRKVTLAGISYHLTLEPPTNKLVVKTLQEQDYLHIFYPSSRDWSYPIHTNLDESHANKRYHDYFKGWKENTKFNLGVVAYNNKSNYSGIAITDHGNFAENFDFYFPQKGSLYSYMHAIKENPGPLQLTNSLISDFSWKSPGENSKIKANQLIDLYFKNRYGKYHQDWKEIYDTISLAVGNAKNIFEAESLHYVLFQNLIWAAPPYSQEEALAFIPQYRQGGTQQIPNGFYSEKNATYTATFMGLDDSVELLTKLKANWEKILLKVKDEKVKNRMQNDIVWFEATLNRYELMVLCCDFAIAKSNNAELSFLKKQILEKVAYLEKTRVTNDVISTFNPRSFLNVIKKFIKLED